jgi:hypothetical protein
VLELILKAAKASIAGRIAVLRTGFYERKRALKQLVATIDKLTGKSGTARQGVVQEYLSFKTFAPLG